QHIIRRNSRRAYPANYDLPYSFPIDFHRNKCYNINQGGDVIRIPKSAEAIIAASALILTGCSVQPEKYTRDIFAMDTFMSLTAYGEQQPVQSALDEAVNRINSLEQALSVTLPDSDISRLNNAAGTPVSVGRDALAIIQKSLEISVKSGGALDITIYPVLKAWGFTTGEYSVPTAEQLASLLEYVDYTQIRLDGDDVTLPEGFSVDLGALAKGYTSDCAAEILRNSGVSSAILSLGGNVCAIGSKPDGDPWKIAVASPFDGENYAGTLTVQDRFVITSGKYERCFTAEDGSRYHHIIDPNTGLPTENGLAAVTVIGGSGIECDALSTALLVLGEEGAVSFWREYGGFDMLLINDDRSIVVTPGIAEQFSSSSGYIVKKIE
ncbi:MAG: FAD:protein FMN transferase, partial [Oscillospiraceae bacterium]